MLNVILFGPPGSGKGTQATKLKEHFNLIHISTGDLLRGEIKNETPLGVEAQNFMDKGLLVPDEIIIGMISSKIDENQDSNGIICDGFPRTVAQAEALDNLLDVKSSKIAGLVALEVGEEELKTRLLERGKTSGRSDDTDLATIERRIVEYKEKTAPVANYYKADDKYVSVAGEGSIDEIFENLKQVFEALSAG
ncbi:MAG: adenylate kinase [Saprospiraceae bacterium]|nr:adenylate kinase [Saprospiraceae bacterium]